MARGRHPTPRRPAEPAVPDAHRESLSTSLGTSVTLRLVWYSIRRGGAGREQPLAAVIRSVAPDIVVLEEATRPEVVESLARETGMQQWSARAGKSLAFMSRLPVAHFAAHRPAISRHAFLEIVPSTTSWRVFGVHLSAVHAAWTERRRLFELRALLRGVAASGQGPHVLIGDFNTVAPGDIFDPRKLPRRLRALVWLSGGAPPGAAVRP